MDGNNSVNLSDIMLSRILGKPSLVSARMQLGYLMSYQESNKYKRKEPYGDKDPVLQYDPHPDF